MKTRISALTLISLLALQGCVKDKPLSSPSTVADFSGNNNVYVVNEGPFNTSHGSVSVYNVESNAVVEDLYYQQNNAYLGNIVQSMSVVNSSYCIVVNNSGKIVFCDKNFRNSHQVTGLVSPRYVLPVSNKKAYVTDLFANAISVVNLVSYTKTSTIPCAGKTEKMVLIYNKVFVTNTDRKYVYVINTITDAVMDSVFVGANAASIVLDQNDKVWVLSTGEQNSSSGLLSRIDPVTNHVEAAFGFQPADSPGYLCLNKTRDTLYFINHHVYRMGLGDAALPSLSFIPNNNRNFYGLGVNPNDYTVYLSDALDYNQNSNIYIYDAKGNQKTFFKTAICANSFYFEQIE